MQFPSLESYLEWINVSAFSASVNHESVKASISVRNCNQASLLAGPSRPERQSNNVWVGPVALSTTEIFKMYPERASGVAREFTEHTREHALTLAHIMRASARAFLCNRCVRSSMGNTSDVIFVGGVDFFYSPVAEGQLSHPIHASPHARGQAEVGAGCGRVEAVGGKVVRAGRGKEK